MCLASRLDATRFPVAATAGMESGAGEGEVVEIIGMSDSILIDAQCYDCHTTSTLLRRKDHEAKTVCIALLLYASWPPRMKSDVISQALLPHRAPKRI
ncbi:hypothetical protein BDR07DRAFT_1476239 [Suillus spraguei]|nr:hypothetical protein BDR07DRAFT_1476239 [Suillus spraguei]